MSRLYAQGVADARQPMTLVIPDSPELLGFVKDVYAVQNPKVAAGSWATLSDYMTQANTFQRFIAWQCLERGEKIRGATVADITKVNLTLCMKWLKDQGRATTTCNKLRRTLLAIHKFAIEEQGMPGQTFRVAKYPEIKHEPRAWRPEQILRLEEAAKTMPPTEAGQWDARHDYALIMFLLNTGTRISAAMLTPENKLDLDFSPDYGLVTVPGEVQKHRRDQPYELLPETVAALRAIRPSPNGLIFGAWPYDDWKKRKWRTLTKRLKQMLVKAALFPSVEEIPKRLELFHKLRRCFVTFIAARHGIFEAQRRCGHSTVEVTKRYLDASQAGDMPSCCEALAGKIVPAPE